MKYGFHFRLVDLILGNLSSSWFSILVNGAPAGFFQATRGLKQGDPLSPYLFILVAEALSRGLTHLLQTNKLAPFGLPSQAFSVSQLCYTDDLIVFTLATRRSVANLFQFLQQYERASGQRVNSQKSVFVVSKSCSLQQIHLVSSFSGIKPTSLPLKYLGNTLFKGRKKPSYFHYLVDNVAKKL